jgi:hypothetical protein
MYQRLKRLVPRPVRLAFEPLLRRVLYIFYRGDAFRCNICGAGLARFVTMPDDRMCPRCGSLSRNRRLYGLLTSEFRALFRALKATPGITYISSDFAGEFVADQHYDLTRLEVPDASVDLITCFHVLEHIVNDRAAVAEIQRVLEDHVRTYSADGLASRLRDVGLAVEVREFADSPDNPEGLTPHEIILVASKIG